MKNQAEIKSEIEKIKEKEKLLSEAKKELRQNIDKYEAELTEAIRSRGNLAEEQIPTFAKHRLAADEKYKQMQQKLATLEEDLKNLDARIKFLTEPEEELKVGAKEVRLQSQPGKGEGYPKLQASGIQGVFITENKYEISFSTNGLKEALKWSCKTDEQRNKIVANVANLVTKKMANGELKEPISVSGTPEIVKLFYLEMQKRNLKCSVVPGCKFQPVKLPTEATTSKIRQR